MVLWTLCWSPCGTKLAASGSTPTINIYSYSFATFALTLQTQLQGAHTKTIRSLHWSRTLLAAASFDGTTSIWKCLPNSSKFTCIATLEGHENEVKCARFSPDQRYLATCGRDRTVWIWSVVSDEDEFEFECEAVLQEHSQDVKTVCWHPTSSILFSAGYDNTVRTYACPLDENEWLCLGKSTEHESTVWALLFSECSLYSVSEDRSLIKWRDANTSSNIFNIDLKVDWRIGAVHEEAIYCVAMFKKWIVTGSADCQLVVSDSTDGHLIRTLDMGSQVNALCPHPSDLVLAAALDNDKIVLVDGSLALMDNINK